MKKTNGYQKCEGEDFDPFNNCKPVNCEMKYFGKRNFFKNPNCVPATLCEPGDHWFYDYKSNDCVDLTKVLTDDEMKGMENRKLPNWVEKSADELSGEAEPDFFEVLSINYLTQLVIGAL